MEDHTDVSRISFPPERMDTQFTQCLYCNAEFVRKRRWIQKYCTESCRTLACRERKKGVSGALKDKAKSLSVSDLYHMQENLFSDMKEFNQVSNLWMQEILRMLNKIKSDQNSELIKDIERKVSDWHSKGMSKVPEIIHEMKLRQLKQELQTGQILTGQNIHNLITVISALFGPMIGEKICDGIKGILSDKKEISIEEKIDGILEIVNKIIKDKNN